MSKYDPLDARNQFEQAVTEDLRAALGKRGLTATHNGTDISHAPAGLPDIVVSSDQAIITIEVTKSKGASQDRELNSIRDHLNQTKADNSAKRCYCIFVSPETSSRMLDGIRDHNQQRANEGKPDLKILPLCFDALELWVTRLRESEADLYPISTFLELFKSYTEFIDDLRIRKLLVQHVFPTDAELSEIIKLEEIERDQHTLELLIKDLALMEDYMKENGIAVAHAAIDTLIYLVFIKLYEEKRARKGSTNRLRSLEAFETYRQDGVNAQLRKAGRAIHKLFKDIKMEGEFISSQMFTEGDILVDSVNDAFVLNYVIPVFSKYNFIGTQIDALGAVYEVLALRAEKDVKVGQFFTPENVVRFMVQLAELNHTNLVLDPACGTGRFLIYAMNDMLEKVSRSEARDKDQELEEVRLHRLFGADIDSRIAKIAKMNMWIHGDGKANIFGGPAYNGLTLHKHSFDRHSTFDSAFDVVLTNPPLGDLNYKSVGFVDDIVDKKDMVRKTIERMPILPRNNLTEKQLEKVRERLATYRRELEDIEQQIAANEEVGVIKEWRQLNLQARSKENNARRRQLGEFEDVKTYRRLISSARNKRRTIDRNEAKHSELEARLLTEQMEWEITGNRMKGGALFLASIWHYLKDNAYPSNQPEWRGGEMLIVLDEGILNTDDYRELRSFIRSRFYIKAVISLSRDTFVPISKTSTKTSIFYAVKKTDADAIQVEPIFYAHVEKVGFNTKGKVCANDLDHVLEKYLDFKDKVLASYAGAEFRANRFLAQNFEGGTL